MWSPLQVALSLLLLIATGLFGRSLVQLASVDLGVRSDRIVTFDADAWRSGYSGKRLADLYEELGKKLAAIPGVERIGLSHNRLLTRHMSGDQATVPGRPVPDGTNETYILYCSDGFFSTMDIPVLLGTGL